MTNLPKEWQERAERYSEHNSDYNDGYHKGASEMQEAILKVIEDYERVTRKDFNQKQLAGMLSVIYKEIQNVKPK